MIGMLKETERKMDKMDKRQDFKRELESMKKNQLEVLKWHDTILDGPNRRQV